MQLYKYTSLKEVILKIYRDSGADRDLNIDDLAYWAYEALEGIASPLVYESKIYGHKEDETWDFDEFKIKLPSDFHKLRALSVDGITAIPSTNTYHEMLDGTCCGWDSVSSSAIETYYDNFGNAFSPSAEPITPPTKQGLEPITFNITNNHITFNVKSGKACMAYWAFPIDDEGFPKVPDEYVIKQAVSAYILERLDWRLFRKGIISGDVYKVSLRERHWSMAAAYALARTPDEHQMETMKNISLKMVVRKDEYLSAFRNLGKQGQRGRY